MCIPYDMKIITIKIINKITNSICSTLITLYTSITYVLATNMLNGEGVCWHTLKTHENGQWKNKVLKMV